MKSLKLLVPFTLISTVSAANTSLAGFQEPSTWQERRLFHPTASERKGELRGRIMIYDGMRDIDIQRALEQNFERVEAMMFVRTKVTDEKGDVLRDPATGEAIVEDDGC